MACYDGWADLGVYVDFRNTPVDECHGCQPPDSDEDGMVGYYFEVSN